MSVSEAVATGIKLASAIETAHRSGILHRDIKPSNVLVTTYSEPALTDFGIAGRMHDTDADTDVRISYPWSPPELLDGRSNGSVASDVYSLGATIWNLLVGRSPFSIPSGDNSSRALTARILHSSPPRTQRPDVPPALDLLLQQCLAKDPRHRPASALELARGLQRDRGAGRLPAHDDRRRDATSPPCRTSRRTPAEDATVLKPVTVISGSVAAGRRRDAVGADAGSSAVVGRPVADGLAGGGCRRAAGRRAGPVPDRRRRRPAAGHHPDAWRDHARRARPAGPDRPARRHRAPYDAGRGVPLGRRRRRPGRGQLAVAAHRQRRRASAPPTPRSRSAPTNACASRSA